MFGLRLLRPYGDFAVDLWGAFRVIRESLRYHAGFCAQLWF